MATAGSIVLDLVMRTGAFETDAKRAEKRLDALAKEAKRVGAALGTAIAGGAVAIATGLTAMVKGAIDSADAMRDLSIRTGVSTETLSAFGYAAQQTGTDIDTLAKGMKVLAKNVADSLNPTSEQAKVFDALGIKVTDAGGKLRDIGDLIPEIADRFKAMEDGTTKAALAQALFGRAGVELTEFLNQGASGLAEYTERARELGLVLDSETAAAADEFNDTLGDLKAVTQGYALALAKELLPDLQNLANSFRENATEGNKVAEMAQGTAQFLRGLADVAHIVSSAFELVGTGIATVAAQAHASLKALTGDFAGAAALYKAASQGFGAEVDEAFGLNKKPAGQFDNVRGGSDTVSGTPVNTAAIARALSNPSAPRAKKGGGKSEAQKAAEDLARAHQSINERLDEQIALFGATGEAAKVRYDLEHGALAALTEAEKAALMVKAEKLDQMELEKELQEAADQAVRQQTEAYAQNQEQIKSLISDMQFELELLGLTNKEREREIALRYAGAEATDEQRQQIAALSDSLYEQGNAMADQIDALDTLRGSTQGLFEDLMSGTVSVGDAFKRFFDDLISGINRIVAQNLAESLFGQQGDSGGGTWGDALGSIFGSFFGGGRAGGGDMMPRTSYLVGEQGPELFVPRTAGMVIPAQQTRAMLAGGGGGSITQQFYTMGTETRMTQERKAQLAGREARRALARTGR